MKKIKARRFIVQMELCGGGDWVRSHNRNTKDVYTKEDAIRRAKAEEQSVHRAWKYRAKEAK